MGIYDPWASSSPCFQWPAAVQALSAAQAIAARLSASASGGAQPPTPSPALAPTHSIALPIAATERRRLPPEPEAASYNQQPYQYPAQPGALTTSTVSLDSAAAQSSIAKAQQAASAMFARFQQQNFPQAFEAQSLSQPPASKPKWDAR